jgi:hypothetical protein
LLEGLNHKFLGPYAGPFKVLEKKLSNTYNWNTLLQLKHAPLGFAPNSPLGGNFGLGAA